MTFQQLQAWPRYQGPTLCFCAGQSKVGHTVGQRPQLLPGRKVPDEPAQPTPNAPRTSKGTVLDTQWFLLLPAIAVGVRGKALRTTALGEEGVTAVGSSLASPSVTVTKSE